VLGKSSYKNYSACFDLPILFKYTTLGTISKRTRQKCYAPLIIPNLFVTSFNSFKYTSVTHFLSLIVTPTPALESGRRIKSSRTQLGLPVQAYVHRHEYLKRTLNERSYFKQNNLITAYKATCEASK